MKKELLLVFVLVASLLVGCNETVSSTNRQEMQLQTRWIEVETELDLLWQELKEGGLNPAAVNAAAPFREELMNERDQLKKQLGIGGD